MVDFLIITALVLILGGAGCYVYKARKSGRKCIGCPYAGSSECSCGRK